MSWITENIQNSLDGWNDKMVQIMELVTQSPADFKGGGIWDVILDINDGLKAIGLALLVIFFLIGVIKTCGNFAEMKRPEVAFKIFIRFAVTKGLVTYGLELMLAIFEIVQGIISIAMTRSGMGAFGTMELSQEIVDAVEALGFLESIPLWLVSMLGSFFITVLSMLVILIVYGRFFKLYLYTAISPLPLSAAAGEPTQGICASFAKSYAAVCLEGVIIVIACIVFSAFATTPPVLGGDTSAFVQVWSYIAELIFNMLVLIGTVKIADRLVREMMGL